VPSARDWRFSFTEVPLYAKLFFARGEAIAQPRVICIVAQAPKCAIPWRRLMKTALATAAFAAVVAIGSPTFAQTTNEQSARSALDAYAQAQPPTKKAQHRRRNRQGGPAFWNPARPDGIVHSTNPAYDVYGIDGEYVGSDPDPIIRDSLFRDPPGNSDND
jgi:hypothetical protein